jgi:hypothetical protein
MTRFVVRVVLYLLASPWLLAAWVWQLVRAHRLRQALRRDTLDCPRCGRVPALGDFVCEACGSIYAGHAGLCSVCLAIVPTASCPQCGLSLPISGGRDA